MPDAMGSLEVNGWINGGRCEVIRGCVLLPMDGMGILFWAWCCCTMCGVSTRVNC
jgi:hypothetical protein